LPLFSQLFQLGQLTARIPSCILLHVPHDEEFPYIPQILRFTILCLSKLHVENQTLYDYRQNYYAATVNGSEICLWFSRYYSLDLCREFFFQGTNLNSEDNCTCRSSVERISWRDIRGNSIWEGNY